MSNIQDKIAHFCQFDKTQKREYTIIPIIPIEGILLHLKEMTMYITLLIKNKKRINICNYKHKKY